MSIVQLIIDNKQNLMYINFLYRFIATAKRQYHGSRGVVSQMVRNTNILQNIEQIAAKVVNRDAKCYADKILHGSRPKMADLPDGSSLVGNNFDVFECPTALPNSIQDSLNMLNGKYWGRIAKEGVTYHSLNYKRKGSSGSYFVRMNVNDQEKYGIAIVFVSDATESHVLLRLFEILPNMLFNDVEYINEDVSQFINDGILDHGFTHLKITNNYELIKCAYLSNRFIYVPINDSHGYATLELSSYQHD